MIPGIGYWAFEPDITLLADTGDFFQLRGAAGAVALVQEIRVFQRGTTTLTMETVRFRRGTGGAGGNALTEYEVNTLGPAATLEAVTLPTTDVGTTTLEGGRGWNMLNEAVDLPPPSTGEIWLGENEDLGIYQATGTAHVDVGIFARWLEFPS